MRYWWVNQKQTFRHEVPGGYLWSPKRNRNGARNPFYDFMREVVPGDAVFSFADGLIKAIGIVASHAYEAPKPLEFGATGAYWDRIGWRVDVRFQVLRTQIKPADCMDDLGPLLPERYAPLQRNGGGLQSVYLTLLSDAFASTLIGLIGREARNIVQLLRVADTGDLAPPAQGLIEWEQHEMEVVLADASLPETTRTAVVLARRGQGLFRQNVMRLEKVCRITRVDRPEHLRASHCKPWRDASNEERLDGENGVLLTPNADHLFDRGFISFEDNGDVLVSPVAHAESLRRMGLDADRGLNVGAFSSGQKHYLEFHRENVFLAARHNR